MVVALKIKKNIQKVVFFSSLSLLTKEFAKRWSVSPVPGPSAFKCCFSLAVVRHTVLCFLARIPIW